MLNKKKLGLLLVMATSINLFAVPSISAAAAQQPVSVKVTAQQTSNNWAIGTQYKAGDIVTYQGKTYTCKQANKAVKGWEPAVVPALWQGAGNQPSPKPTPTPTPVSAVKAWASGSHYSIGNIVTYKGKTYTCRQEHNSQTGWEPAVVPALWQEGGDQPTPTPPTPTPTPPTPDPNPIVNHGEWGAHEFVPYTDVMLWPTFSINNAYAKTGQKYFTLAFITSDVNGNPAWGGVTPMKDDFYKDEISNIRKKGGDVIVSFGGSNGTELAISNKDVKTLQAKYQSVIDRYKLNWIDLDIEGATVADKASVDRRNKALKGLQQNNKDLTIAYCLPVLPSGLTSDGLNILKNAKENGVRVDVVNIMAMDYGPAMTDGQMGDSAIKAAIATHNQCNSLGINAKIGITPMIGKNDVAGEVFTQADAKKLLTWAKANSWVKSLSMWSITRDNQKGGPLYISTQIPQTDFEFTKIFESFSQSK